MPRWNNARCGFQKGHKFSPRSRKHSEETKRKIGDANRGHIMSEKQRKQLSDIKKKNPNRFWLGKKRSPLTNEQRERMSKSQMGNTHGFQKGEKHYMWRGGRAKDLNFYKRRYRLAKFQERTFMSNKHPGGHNSRDLWEPIEVTDGSQGLKIALMFVSMIGATLFAVRVLDLLHQILEVLKQITVIAK